MWRIIFPSKPNLPSHLVVVYGVTRLGGVDLNRPPALMQTSKILQKRKKDLYGVDSSFAHY
jgi:hypothetical protein